jgi:DNA recombination protein RmuC
MNELPDLLALPVMQFGGTVVTLGQAAAASSALVLCAALLLGVLLWRSGRARAEAAEEAALLAQETATRLSGILQAQAELQGRMGTIADVFGSRQAELNQSLGQRLDSLTGRIGQTMTEQTRATHQSLSKLQERLAVIDTAQSNIQSLAGQVVQLQAILSNKQTRGAFGQSRMEAIVADGLPMGGYEFQSTLSNGSRPDCLVRLPNGAPPLVIDAKFPLEGWNAIRAAVEADGATDAVKAAQQSFRRDLDVHVKAIADKYLVAGETHDTAFMFVPSESVFAEIHENFEQVVQRAHKARVVIVSPSLLMLSIQVIQSILKDASMREQAHLIQGEVVRLMEDLGRMEERVRKLQGHFGQAVKDIDDILVSSAKVVKRGRKIEALEFGGVAEAEAESGGEPRQMDGRTGQLRLRVVDDQS